MEQFIRTYREFTGFEPPQNMGALPPAPLAVLPTAAKDLPPRKSPHGQAQPVFESYVRSVLRDVRRPLRSPEIIEEFRKRGHPIGGNETRTAWNRLWNAQNNGVLIQVPKYGYWLADEPVPPLPDKPQKHVRRGWGNSIKDTWAGRPPGPKKLLNEAQVKLAQEWRAAGKSLAQIGIDFGGISAGTIGLAIRRAEKEAEKPPKGKLKRKTLKRK